MKTTHVWQDYNNPRQSEPEQRREGRIYITSKANLGYYNWAQNVFHGEEEKIKRTT